MTEYSGSPIEIFIANVPFDGTNPSKRRPALGKEVIFRKAEENTPNILEAANDIFDDHADLMKRLENLKLIS